MRQKGIVQIALIVGIVVIIAAAGFLEYSARKSVSQTKKSSESTRAISEAARNLKDLSSKKEDASQSDISSQQVPSPTPAFSPIDGSQYALPSTLNYSSKSGWQTLTSPKGYSLDVPTAWDLDITRTIDGDFTCKDISKEGRVTNIFTYNYNNQTLEQEAGSIKKDKLSRSTNKLLNDQRLTLSGLSAIYYVFSSPGTTSDLPPFIWQYVFIQKGDKVINMVIISTEIKYNANKNEINQIIGTLR